jgi:hypothetical protein
MSIPKRHHYLPESYLEGFTDGKGFWVFDREENEYRYQLPKDTGVERHYYTFDGKDGNKHPEGIESLFNDVESEAKPILTKLDERKQITQKDKVILAYFVSFLMMRVPASRKIFNENVKKQSVQLYKSMTSSEESIAEIINLQREADINIKYTPTRLCPFLLNFDTNV